VNYTLQSSTKLIFSFQRICESKIR
jgi:hypothetical protein